MNRTMYSIIFYRLFILKGKILIIISFSCLFIAEVYDFKVTGADGKYVDCQHLKSGNIIFYRTGLKNETPVLDKF